MAGLFSSITSAFSGGDSRIAGQIERFSDGFLAFGDIPRGFGLRHDEASLLAAILSLEIYQSYCKVDLKKDANPREIERLQATVQSRRDALSLKPEARSKMFEVLQKAASDLSKLARDQGKFARKFDSADGLSETMVQPIVSMYSVLLRAAKRDNAS